MINKHLFETILFFLGIWLLATPATSQSDSSVIIQKIFLSNTEYKGKKDSDITIFPTQRHIRIELNAPLSIKDSFLFYLSGTALDTVKTAFPTIQYNNLTGGQYHLMMFCLRNGRKSAPVVLNLRVKKKLIEEEWFQLALFLSVLLVVSGFSFLAVQYNYRQKMRDQNLRLKLAADLHERVGGLLTSINIWAITLKRSVSEALSVDNTDTLNKIIGTSKDVSLKMKETIWLTNPENDLMDKLFERMMTSANQMLTPQTEVVFDYVLEDIESMKISMSQREDVLMMFTEIVNNIRKHAESPLVSITIKREKHAVHMVIKDNGKGFDVKAASEGYGLTSLRWRAKRSFIQLTIDSEIGRGTTVLMIIPEL